MRRQAKESVLLTHFIEYDLSGKNKLVHDEELRVAKYLSNVNDLTVHIWSCVSTKMTSSFGILHH